ncbi:MAG: hypothetical protein ACO3ND_06460 [Opitutales bacterium]
MRVISALICLLALQITLSAQTKDAGPVDFEKARGYLRREQAGETLTASERAYLERAKAERARGSGRKDAEPAKSAVTSTGMTPLTELKSDHRGESGGLYGEGANVPPPKLAEAATQAAAGIRPLAPAGKPSETGRIVLLSIGMSNTTQEFSAFQTLSDQRGARAKNVVLVDGAQGGQSADRIADPEAGFWKVIAQRLQKAGVSAPQVQAVWFKQAFPGPRSPFPAEAARLKDYIAQDLAALRKHCPGVRLVFFSSRIYAGHARTGLNPEPHAYESAFAVRWTIMDQLKDGGLKPGAPVLVWGPYLWADGLRPRASDGLVWKPEDFGPDGTHPSPAGRQKVAEQLEQFLTTSPFSKGWYVGR